MSIALYFQNPYFSTVKLLCLLSVLFVLLLSVRPCCTDADCGSKNVTQINDQAKASSKEKDCGGCCSPFYACGACVGFVVTKALNYSLVITPAPQIRHATQYRYAYVEAVTLSIWQPPQIG